MSNTNSKTKLLAALELLKENSWHEAHNIVQDLEMRQAYWLHAVLHQIEGDQANARYWYKRAKIDYFPTDIEAELAKIEASLEIE